MNKVDQLMLEPLSKATQTLLEPLNLDIHDRILIEVDLELQNFLIRVVRVCAPLEEVHETIETVGGIIIGLSSWNAAWPIRGQWFRRIPEHKELPGGLHQCATTDFTALVIHHLWPTERIIFSSHAAESVYKFLILRFFSQGRIATMMAQYKLNGVVPSMPASYVEHPDPDLVLADYQKVGLLASYKQESFALFMKQGTGKTPIVIARVCMEGLEKRAVGRGMYRVLVICPGQVRANWEREFHRFSTAPGKTTVLRGSKINRQKNLVEVVRDESDCVWSVAIISTDSVALTQETLLVVPWDLVVLDEGHSIKSPRTKRSKACRKFTDSVSRQRTILTGTPIANAVFDLWSQLEFLGSGQSGFQKFANFRGFHGKFESTKGRSPVQKLVGIKALPLIQERLARLSYQITKEEANLQLPPKVYDFVEVEMTTKQREVYTALSTQLVAEIDHMLSQEDATVSVHHILTKLLRLAQVCSGHVRLDSVTEDGKGEVIQVDSHNPKVQAVLDILNNSERDPKGKVLIWCCFVEDIRILSESLKAVGIKHVGYHEAIQPEFRIRDKDLANRKFNCDPECRVFLANPASAGEGLNILGYDPENPDDQDTYVDHAIFFSCNWSAIQRQQAEDRCHRRGTRAKVQITDLAIVGTIDEEIRARVNGKKQKAIMIQDIRKIMKGLTA